MNASAKPEPVGFGYRDAEQYTGASERFLRDEVAAGRLRAFRVGNRVRFHKDDLDAWLNLLRQEEAERRAPTPKRRRRQAVA